MNTNPVLKFGLMATCAAVLAACNTLPERDAALESARVAHDAARNDPNVQALAPLEYRRADEAYRQAETAWQGRADAVDVDHLAYVAQRRAEIAIETARLKAADAAIASADADRTAVQLEARTRQANRAQRDAQVAQMQAEATRQQAMDAQQQAAQSRAEADAAQQQAAQSGAVAQALASQLAELQAKNTDRGMVVTLGDLLFETGSARLRQPGLRAVDKLATFMRQYPQRSVSIEGFTDNVGNDEYNQRLSERRSEAVRSALIADGIEPQRLSTRGFGEEYPVASNNDSTGRQLNRRVEIVISDDQGHIAPRSASRGRAAMPAG